MKSALAFEEGSNKIALRKKSLQIYHLANPRGVYYFCEVCDRNARIMCPHCRITCYCCEEHRQADWESIHGSICDLLPALRMKDTKTYSIQSDNEQSLNITLLKYFVKVTIIKAREYLYLDNYTKALPAAVHSMHFNFELYGSNSLQNVNSLLLIAESKLGLGHIEQARQLYNQADWLTKKFPPCPDSILSNLYRTLAKIMFAKEKFIEVCKCSSKDIFYSCNVYGPNDHRTVGGYFQLGLTFEKLRRLDISKSLFIKVTDIWMKALTRIVRVKIYKSMKESDKDFNLCLDISEQAEAMRMLSFIYWKSESHKTAHCIAMLFFIQDKISQAQNFGRIALRTYKASFDAENPVYLQEAHEFIAFYLNRTSSSGSDD